jgi:hypothetical protein
VGLFYYDNGTFIVESFLPEPITIKILAKEPVASLVDLLNDEILQGTTVSNAYFRNRKGIPERSFEITLNPHSFRVFQTQAGK